MGKSDIEYALNNWTGVQSGTHTALVGSSAVLSGNASIHRKFLMSNAHATDAVWIKVGATAVAGHGILLAARSTVEFDAPAGTDVNVIREGANDVAVGYHAVTRDANPGTLGA